ncbi:MAG: 2-oxoacid:acceptor oxidoreductase family protein [Anaerolineales bacterium]|nr:2-oxoacid:acceptor oxidoreductase family protein [Chloroflexota bacterium]MBL6983542.1 2-oxoacid:acceptor oxidoreductase family protein [Anaerolineales bacterium]
MKETSIIISGFGGQGTLFSGQVLAYAALDNNFNVTWIPSYGPEMRGGTASCTVIISKEEIGSPLVRNPDISVVLNLPSLDKYEHLTKSGGCLVANSSLINRGLNRDDLKNVYIPANEIAEEIGLSRMANMVMIGGMLCLAPVLSLEVVKQALSEHIPERHRRTLPMNFDAMQRGYEFAEQALAEVAA